MGKRADTHTHTQARTHPSGARTPRERPLSPSVAHAAVATTRAGRPRLRGHTLQTRPKGWTPRARHDAPACEADTPLRRRPRSGLARPDRVRGGCRWLAPGERGHRPKLSRPSSSTRTPCTARPRKRGITGPCTPCTRRARPSQCTAWYGRPHMAASSRCARRAPNTTERRWHGLDGTALVPRQLPPGYRDYWLALEAEDKRHIAALPRGAAMPPARPADPFAEPPAPVRATRDALGARAPQGVCIRKLLAQNVWRASGARRRRAAQLPAPKRAPAHLGGPTLPAVHMSDAQRELVEALVMDAETLDLGEGAGPAEAAVAGNLQAILTNLGFWPPQAREALQYTRTLDAALSWLCLHVPEDDLPERYRATAPSQLTFVAVRSVCFGARGGHETASLTRAAQRKHRWSGGVGVGVRTRWWLQRARRAPRNGARGATPRAKSTRHLQTRAATQRWPWLRCGRSWWGPTQRHPMGPRGPRPLWKVR